MTTSAVPSYAGYRFPAEVISHAVWLYFRFPLSLRMMGELLAARGIIVSHKTVRQWALKFGQGFANQIRRRLPAAGDIAGAGGSGHRVQLSDPIWPDKPASYQVDGAVP